MVRTELISSMVETGFTAEFYLRRALTHLWTNVCWRSPINDSEAAVLDDVAASLKRAFELDPNLEYPWAEWKQVLDLLENWIRFGVR